MNIIRERKYTVKDNQLYGCWGDYINPDGTTVKLVENWFKLNGYL